MTMTKKVPNDDNTKLLWNPVTFLSHNEIQKDKICTSHYTIQLNV